MNHATAKVSCFARAYHQRNNRAPVFADSAAFPLLGDDYGQISESMAQGIGFFPSGLQRKPGGGVRLIVDRFLSPSVLGRSAYCESALKNEVRIGCGQYALFASGYDTYAARNPDTALSVFELDLPDMIADKRRRVERAGLSSKAAYVPCDLSEDGWADPLTASGFSRRQKAFASLLGISHYLEKAAFMRLLKRLGETVCEGSAVCFDYPADSESRETRVNALLANGAGEPMKAKYSYAEMEALLAESGFLIYEHLDHAELTRRFFSDYNRENPAHPMSVPEGVCCVLAVRKGEVSQ